MILPIYTYGQAVLRQKTESISENNKEIQTLIDNMFETMYSANGVGLAAPQVGKALRLFIIDAEPMLEDDEKVKGKSYKKVFINPSIEEFIGHSFSFEEGCLSIPGIRENVNRPEGIVISYLDRDFNKVEEELDGMEARVIQHEFDHIEGILFTDKISPLKKKLLKRKLQDMSKGRLRAEYPVKVPR